MMTFYHIADMNCFFQVIDTCIGGIFFQADENRYVDIRHNSLIKKLLAMSCQMYGVEKLELYVENTDDQAKLLQYMIDNHTSYNSGAASRSTASNNRPKKPSAVSAKAT